MASRECAVRKESRWCAHARWSRSASPRPTPPPSASVEAFALASRPAYNTATVTASANAARRTAAALPRRCDGGGGVG
eukprot:360600-Chlamydomonas_euryale.AAC.7